jgi:hypothetical protein
LLLRQARFLPEARGVAADELAHAHVQRDGPRWPRVASRRHFLGGGKLP